MTEPQWTVIRDKRALKPFTAQLQAFKATDDPPRLGNHRALPHPMQWEWEAQRHVRALVQQYKAGDVALLRLGPDGDLLGVVHIRLLSRGTRMVVSLEVMAVAQHMRGSTPPHVGDELYAYALQVLNEIIPDEVTQVVLAAMVHVANRASQRLLKRHAFEPAQAATTEADYEKWSLLWRSAPQ